MYSHVSLKAGRGCRRLDQGRGCEDGSRARVREGFEDVLLLALKIEKGAPPQGRPASSSVWREDPGLLSRPCRKRRPSAREDGGVSRILEWVAIPSYRGSSQPRDRIQVACIAGRFFTS